MAGVYNWNLKLWAVIVAVIVILAVTGVCLSDNERDDATAITIGIANREGSGVLGKDPGMVTMENGYAVFHADKWKGKIVATPGTGTLQEIFIKSQMKAIGLECVSYEPSNGVSAGSDKVYIWTCTNLEAFKDNVRSGRVDAAIVWEPWYSDLASGDYKKLCTTGEMEGLENHFCCLIDANSAYLDSHQNETVRFLAGYVKAVQWINDAKKDRSLDDHGKLLDIASKCTGITDRNVLEAAVNNIKYIDDTDQLLESYADLIVKLGEDNAIPKKMTREEANRFASAHIDTQHLENAKKIERGSYNRATVNVGAISQDLHQLALHVGVELGFFDEYGIEVKISMYDTGAKIMVALMSGNVNVGFVGAPPTVMYAVNMS